MKKITSLILVFMMILSLCACGENTGAAFEEDLSSLTNRIQLLRMNCDLVVKGTRTIWENVGAEDFWTNYKAVRSLTKDQSKTDYDTDWNDDSYATVWCAARGLCPEKIDSNQDMTAEGMDYTIDLCVAFNNAFAYIDENIDPLSEEVRTFQDRYGDKFEEETHIIKEWYIELSMYVDFSKNPSGNLSAYTDKAAEYEESMDRFEKTINTY